MKYDPEASEAENQRRWLRHAQARGPLRPIHELLADHQSTALKLAETLSDLEARICGEIAPVLSELTQRKASPSDSLEDYDITLTVTYLLRPTDFEWNDWPGKPPCWTFLDLLASGPDWNDLARIGRIGTSLTVKTDEKPIPI